MRQDVCAIGNWIWVTHFQSSCQLPPELSEYQVEIHPVLVLGYDPDDNTSEHIQNHPCNTVLLLSCKDPKK